MLILLLSSIIVHFCYCLKGMHWRMELIVMCCNSIISWIADMQHIQFYFSYFDYRYIIITLILDSVSFSD